MTELVPAMPLQIWTLVWYGVAPAAVLAVGIVLLLLLGGAYLVALATFLLRHARREGRRAAMALTAMLVVPMLVGRPLPGQQRVGGTRVIEPPYTRLFGADSMEVVSATVSPDGRWIAFRREESAHAYNLWIVATAGGEPIRITSGRHSDGGPVWFPTGDRLLFNSDRTNSLMTIPIDPATGRASGPPRQVSLEYPGAMGAYTVSPDGHQIAYIVRHDAIERIIVNPASGGAARTVVDFDGTTQGVGLGNLQWTSDDWLYYTQRVSRDRLRQLYRVRPTGGSPQEVPLSDAIPPVPSLTQISADGRHLLRQIDHIPGQDPRFQIATTDGKALAQFTLRGSARPTGFTPDGRGIVVVESNRVAPIRVVPVTGGPVRQLTEARSYDWPLGWSPDGTRISVATKVDGHQAILDVSLTGGPAAQWTYPAEAREPIALSRDRRFLLYGVGTDPLARTLRIRRLADGETREIREPNYYPVVPGGAIAAGGGYGVSDEGFLTFARSGDRIELWVTPPEGTSRLIRSFPISYVGNTFFGVRGDRVAYRERRGDSSALFVAEGQSGRPRLLATVAGDANEPTWSYDGRWIAYDYYPPGDNPRYAVLLIGLAPDGTVSTPPRILEAGPMWGWQIEWLPTNDAFTVFGMTGAASETHVYLVSLREGEHPLVVTRDDPSVRWGYELSPDGRYVAYPAEIPRGSSIWRVDLSEVLATSR